MSLHLPPSTHPKETNNQAHQAYAKEHPEDLDPPYANVACDVAIQTAKPKTLEEVMNLDIGSKLGNRELQSVLY